MFCSKCGREVSDQAKFCNYCGTPLGNAQPQPVQKPAPVQPAAQPVQQTQPAQPVPAKKKESKAGKRILTIVVAVIVYFVARGVTENVLMGQQKSRSTPNTNAISNTIKINSSAKSNTGDLLINPTIGCNYGALYQNGYLTYGAARVYVPGYSLLKGEGDSRDWLASPKTDSLLYVEKRVEGGKVSFAACKAEDMLAAYSQYPGASMMHFSKTKVNGYPVIRYVVSCTVDGEAQYMGEAIVFPGEYTNETLRIAMVNLKEAGYSSITQMLDTLDISSMYTLDADDTNTIGLNRITVK